MIRHNPPLSAIIRHYPQIPWPIEAGRMGIKALAWWASDPHQHQSAPATGVDKRTELAPRLRAWAAAALEVELHLRIRFQICIGNV